MGENEVDQEFKRCLEKGKEGADRMIEGAEEFIRKTKEILK